MGKVYLSPSSQTYNVWTDNTTEAERMQEFSDLVKKGLKYIGHKVYGSNNTKFNDPGITNATKRNRVNLNKRIKESNQKDVDAHVALHSNAGGGKGPKVYYYDGSANGKSLAVALNKKLTKLYGITREPVASEAGSYAELGNTVAPAIIIEIAFHDNVTDVKWMKNNKQKIADVITAGIDNYLERTTHLFHTI